MARILCISDFHYSIKDNPEIYTDDNGVKLPSSVGTKEIDVLLAAMEEVGPIDLLVFCGDIISGKDSAHKKREAIDNIGKLINGIINSKKIFAEDVVDVNRRIIYVPGNHDVDRNNGGKLLSGISEIFNNCLHPKYDNLRIHKYAPVFIFDDLKLIIAAVSTIENSCSKNESIHKVLEIVNSLPDKYEQQKNDINQLLNHYCSHDIPSITSETVDRFIFANREINQNRDEYKDYKRIMISHHPLLEGIETFSSLKKYGGTVGGYRFMKSAEEYGYSLFVHGHLHEQSCVEIIDHLSESPKPVIQLGLPKMTIDRDDCGCILIDTNVSDPYCMSPFSCALLKLDSIAWKFKEMPFVKSNRRDFNSIQGDKILVDYEIASIIKDNKIVKHGDLRNVEAASYDCALGYQYKKGTSRFCNWSELPLLTVSSDSKGPGGIVLKPHETALIYSYEEFNVPSDMVLHASPISSWLRLGIRFDISFFVDPGFEGQFSIPVTNESDNTVIIDAQKPIISLEFVKLTNSCEKRWGYKHKQLEM